jgi:hypothetical protein
MHPYHERIRIEENMLRKTIILRKMVIINPNGRTNIDISKHEKFIGDKRKLFAVLYLLQ